MRIKLVLPTIYDENGRLVKTAKAMLPNLTVFYLAGMVPAGHQLSIVEESVQDLNLDEPADLVAITTNTSNIERAYQLAAEFRRRGAKVVMGGIHVTLRPEEAAAHADAVVLGEAEDSWPQVLRDAEQGTLKPVYQEPPRESLDGLPMPRHDLIDYSHYVRIPFRKSPILPVNTSRGCPHDCDFCSVSVFWGRKLRFRPVADVIAEIKHSGGDTFFFTDDNFCANPTRTRELCEALMPLRIKYFCQMDATVYRQPELVELAAKSGCMLAFVGFESMSPASLASVKKGFNKPEEYAQLLDCFRRHGIQAYASLMFGLDADTPELVDSTVDFLVRQKTGLAAFFPLCPFPGTVLHQRLNEQGRLVDSEWWLTKSRHPNFANRIRYEDESRSGVELCKRAMRQYYSMGSILKRFALPRRNALFPLIMNLMINRRIRKSFASFM